MKQTDDELIMMINEGSEDAKNLLLSRYESIINIIIKKYSASAKVFAIPQNDLYQEALVGFSMAINTYKQNRDASFNTFMSLCIERRLQNTIVKASRLKNKIIQDSLSLDHYYVPYDLTLKDMISDNNANDPLLNISNYEEVIELINRIKESLSSSELEVFDLMLSGLSYNEIATILDKEPKKIDNTIQRIRKKAREIYGNMA